MKNNPKHVEFYERQCNLYDNCAQRARIIRDTTIKRFSGWYGGREFIVDESCPSKVATGKIVKVIQVCDVFEDGVVALCCTYLKDDETTLSMRPVKINLDYLNEI